MASATKSNAQTYSIVFKNEIADELAASTAPLAIRTDAKVSTAHVSADTHRFTYPLIRDSGR